MVRFDFYLEKINCQIQIFTLGRLIVKFNVYFEC